MKIFAISDLHFGARDDERLYKEICDNFLTRVKEDKPEIIAITGDLFDKRVYVNSDAAVYVNKFIYELTKTDSIIIMCGGTKSHDADQLNSLSQYTSDKFYICNTVSELHILGLDLLILPEEYINDMTYYDKYLKKKYDFVFGHGMFKHVSFGGTNKIGHLNKKSYVFDAKQFDKNIKYYVVFGHIHIHSVFKKIIYVGSYTRMNFGEEEPKGFMIFDLNPKKGACTYEFIENVDAPKYKTIHGISIPEDMEQALNYMRGFSEHNDKLRILIVEPITDNVFNNILGFIKNHPNTTMLKKTPNKVTEDIEKVILDKQKHITEKIDMYKGLSFIEITQKIAKDEFHEDFSTEDIHRIINTPI